MKIQKSKQKIKSDSLKYVRYLQRNPWVEKMLDPTGIPTLIYDSEFAFIDAPEEEKILCNMTFRRNLRHAAYFAILYRYTPFLFIQYGMTYYMTPLLYFSLFSVLILAAIIFAITRS
jgi:hypothetical protein